MRKFKLHLAAGASLLVAVNPALGQEVAPAPGEEQSETRDGRTEVIVVTAQRRAENLQDVPIATTAFSSERLTELGIAQSNQIAFSTPNLYINGSAENAAKITLRGVGSNDFIPTANPGVGTYVDEVYNGVATAQTFQLFDLERVEVLRGPQGTLYGKNSTGGTINYISKKPDFSGFGARLQGSIANYSGFEVEGALNTPLSENLAARASFIMRTRDGYIDNLVREKNGRFLDAWAARLLVAWEPSDNLDILLNVHGGKFDGDSAHRQAFGQLPGGVDVVGYDAPADPFINENDLDTFDIAESIGGYVRIELETGPASLISITSYEEIDRDIDDDVDDGPVALTHNRFTSLAKVFSQELRITGDSSNFLWTVGGQYYREKHDVQYDLRFFECTLDNSCALLPGVFPAAVFDGNNFGAAFAPLGLQGLPLATTVDLDLDQTNESWAAFADATYNISDQFAVSAGLRYTTETRSISDTSTVTPIAAPNVSGGLFPGFPLFEDEQTWDNLSGRLVLEYEPNSDLLFYGSVATGFRAGNFNGGSFARIEQLLDPVNPEKITNYELGLKADLLDNKLRINAAVFYSDFTDLQVAIFENSQQFLRNAADATIMGAELEVQAALTTGLTARFAVGYLDTEYQNFIETADDPATPQDETRDLSGNRLVNSPEWTLSGGIEYTTSLSADYAMEIGVDARYQSAVFFTPFNDLLTTNLQQGGYALANARISFENEANNWSVGAYVTNIFDREFATDGNGIGAPFFYDLVAYGAPRRYGVRFSAEF